MSKAHRIIELFFRGDYQDDIRNQFFKWFVSQVSPLDRDRILQDVWDELRVEVDASTWESLRQVQQKIDLQHRSKARSLYVKIARIAAVFLPLLVSTFLIYHYTRNHEQPEESKIVEYFVPNGQTGEIVLPDSSRVTVSAGSILLYPDNFAQNRSIYLNGEAKFTVKRDEKKPFIVKTCDMNVEVLGTVFYVSSYADNQQTITTLASGKVKVNFHTAGNDPVILTPNEQVVFDRTTEQVTRNIVRTNDLLDLEYGHLVFKTASLDQIVKSIERRYDVRVYLNTKNYANEKLTVKFMYDDTLDEVFHSLQYIIRGLNYAVDGNKVYIY